MYLIDWIIIFGLFAAITVAANITKKYTKSVADFLAANRCAGRYLLSVSQGLAGVGSISLIAGFEMYYKAGFTAAWWQLIMIVVTTIVFLSGWIVYRFRQTRALTLAQFLEIRYSRHFRIFSGFVAWLSGIINFGIFPAVGARFFIHFCNFPDTMPVYALIMGILLFFALYFTFVGGQIAVIVTDFIQGVFSNIAFVIIPVVVFYKFGWPQITDALSSAPVSSSLLHPFHTQDAKDFNIWFYLILAFNYFYAGLVWQGSQGYNASALNAHEARMGKILSTWRILALNMFMMIIPICAYTFMHHPDFAIQAQQSSKVINSIKSSQLQEQMTTVIAMRHFLPKGIIGMMAAVMLAAFIGNHGTYLHSWGSIFIQDVLMPFRKTPFTQKQHLRLLKLSIFGVAIFIYIFSLIFRQTEYIYMFFMITGAIFTGGAGAAVIGGLYWKRGTTAAAWSAMILGSVLSVLSVILKQIDASYPFTNSVMSYIASQNGAILGFYASAIAILSYIFVSLIGTKTVFNMDMMLHRGKYKIEEHQNTQNSKSAVGRLGTVFGITDEFNTRDKILYISTFVWTGLWIIIFVTGTICNYIMDIKTQPWITFWWYYTFSTLFLSAVTTLWFTLGGLIDLKKMFKLLSTIRRNDLDDGMVNGHHNLGEDTKDNKELLHEQQAHE
jgi:SSS family solute:Na+ symporter